MRWLAIANPAAGRAREAVGLLRRLRSLRHLAVEVASTAAPGDGTRLAREASAYDGVIAIGGDGTIAEVLQGLDLRRQHLAVLPAGHGNCLARDLGVHDRAVALDALRRGRSLPLDLMHVRVQFANGADERRLCASTLAVGYVSEVVTMGRQRLPGLGRAAYAAAAMLVVPRRFEARIAANGDGPRSRHYTGLVVNNTAHLANFRGFPDASVHDGLLDVMEQDHAWPRQLLHNLSVLAGSKSFGPLRMQQADCATIDLGEPGTFMLDGELLRDVRRVEVRCLRAAARCIAGSP